MLCNKPLTKEWILQFKTICKELVLYNRPKLKRIFHMHYYYEKRRYENCRNQNSVQRYNKKINCTNILTKKRNMLA